ncbi:MAG: formylmethanofuran dehydrogenase subunit C [Planctomycetales bacterium]|nr:formylmethanofuran dehydrogenase subunit C [Planctomycetales bacterium]
MALEISIRETTSVPLEVEGILPETVRDKSLDEIRRLSIYHGNRQEQFGDYFDISGDPADETMIWQGNLAGVHWLGTKMNGGVIRVEGDAGRHVGSEMRRGEIHVSGNASDWVGGEMHGGLIHIRGRAGHLVGAAYRGSPRGMTGGTILVHGSVGNELGHTMRRGLIAVGGDTGDLVGFNMLAGTILIFGEAGIRPGAGMHRGTIGFFGPSAPPLLPSFRRACRFQPDVLALLASELRRLDFPLPDSFGSQPINLFHGDMIEGGRGEVMIAS